MRATPPRHLLVTMTPTPHRCGMQSLSGNRLGTHRCFFCSSSHASSSAAATRTFHSTSRTIVSVDVRSRRSNVGPNTRPGCNVSTAATIAVN